MADDTVQLVLTLNTKQASNALKQLSKQFRATSKSITKETTGWDKQMQVSTGNMTRHFRGMIAGIGVSLTAFGAKSFIEYMIAPSRDMERFRLQYWTLYGNIEEAQARLHDLFVFARVTPFELDEVINAHRMMKVFGIDSMRMLTAIGDAASGTGHAFEEVARWVSRLSTGITGRPLWRLSEMAIVTRRMLQMEGLEFDKSGAFRGSIIRLLDTVQYLMEERFGGFMEEAAKNFDGYLNNLQDAFYQIRVITAKPIFTRLKEHMKTVFDFLLEAIRTGAIYVYTQGFRDAFNSIIDVVEGFVKFVIKHRQILSGAVLAFGFVVLASAIRGTLVAMGAFVGHPFLAAMTLLGVALAVVVGHMKKFDKQVSELKFEYATTGLEEMTKLLGEALDAEIRLTEELKEAQKTLASHARASVKGTGLVVAGSGAKAAAISKEIQYYKALQVALNENIKTHNEFKAYYIDFMKRFNTTVKDMMADFLTDYSTAVLSGYQAIIDLKTTEAELIASVTADDVEAWKIRMEAAREAFDYQMEKKLEAATNYLAATDEEINALGKQLKAELEALDLLELKSKLYAEKAQAINKKFTALRMARTDEIRINEQKIIDKILILWEKQYEHDLIEEQKKWIEKKKKLDEKALDDFWDKWKIHNAGLVVIGEATTRALHSAWNEFMDHSKTLTEQLDSIWKTFRDSVIHMLIDMLVAHIANEIKMTAATAAGALTRTGIRETEKAIATGGVSLLNPMTWIGTLGMIPFLQKGGLIEKGTVGLFEGAGTELVAPKQDFIQVAKELIKTDVLPDAGVGGSMSIHNYFDKSLLILDKPETINNIFRIQNRGERRAKRRLQNVAGQKFVE